VRVSKTAISAHDIPTRFWRDRRGAVAVAVAVLLPVLIGFAGIGIEVGLWYAIQRQNQSATDAAAISAALEYAAQIESGVPTDPTAAATTAANCNLFSTSSSSSNAVCPLPSSASNTITLYPCYGFTAGSSSSCNTSNSNGGPPDAVQVVLTQPLNTAFANFVTAIWGPNVNTVNVTTTAIAAFPTSSACILALDPSAASAVSVDNGTLSNLNCWVASNSSLGSALNCNGCTVAGPTNVVGGDAVSNGGQLNGSPNRTYASAIADPYTVTLTHTFLTAGMPTTPCGPPVPGPPGTQTYSGNCIIITGPSPLTGTINLSAGAQIASGLSFIGPGLINLSPGIYWITDGNLGLNGLAGNITLTCTTCSPGGAGVTIIFTTAQGSAGTIGTLLPTGSVTITLNAPGPGHSGQAYPGLLMVQDPLAVATSGTIGGSATSRLSGLIYFPSGNLRFVGDIQTDTSNCLVAVAKNLVVTGNISLNGSGCKSAGLTTVPTILSVFLAV
jgi:Flp pilus assembly protein TadG